MRQTAVPARLATRMLVVVVVAGLALLAGPVQARQNTVEQQEEGDTELVVDIALSLYHSLMLFSQNHYNKQNITGEKTIFKPRPLAEARAAPEDSEEEEIQTLDEESFTTDNSENHRDDEIESTEVPADDEMAVRFALESQYDKVQGYILKIIEVSVPIY